MADTPIPVSEEIEKAPEKIEATSEEISLVKQTYSLDRNQLILQHPWFGLIIMGLGLVVDQSTPIAGINYKNIHFNPIPSSKRKEGTKSYPELKPDTRLFLLSHEILHPALGHCSYLSSSAYNHHLQNIAMDAVINRILCGGGKYASSKEDIRKDLGGGVFIDVRTETLQVGLPNTPNFFELAIPGIMSSDWHYIYEQLLKESQGENAEKLKKAADSFASMFLDIEADPEQSTDSLASDRTGFLTRVAGISKELENKQPGSTPGAVKDFLQVMFDPKISWAAKLRSHIEQSIEKEDFSFRTNGRKQHIAILPLLNPKPVYNVFVALDTSGSMSDQDVIEALTELKGLRDTHPMNLTIIQCDYAITSVKTYDNSEEIDWQRFEIDGRGGTTFEPPFEYVNDLVETGETSTPSVFVYFTDGYGNFPSEPDYHTIWVRAKNGYKDFPFGEVIDIE